MRVVVCLRLVIGLSILGHWIREQSCGCCFSNSPPLPLISGSMNALTAAKKQ